MIEESVCNYLLGNAEVLDALGNNHIFFERAPTKVLTPWIVVSTKPGGMLQRLTFKFVAPQTMLSIIIESDDAVFSRQVGEVVRKSLDFYRGDMYGTRDTYFRCGSPYMRDGILDVLQCVVPVTVSFLEEITYPITVG